MGINFSVVRVEQRTRQNVEKFERHIERKIGIWGQRYLRFIKKHRKVFYTNLLTTGVLNKHLAEVDTRAQTMLNDLIRKFAEQEGANEMLKEQNQMEWVGRMNNIRSRVEEVVVNEIMK